jgi:hypothetical protein
MRVGSRPHSSYSCTHCRHSTNRVTLKLSAAMIRSHPTRKRRYLRVSETGSTTQIARLEHVAATTTATLPSAPRAFSPRWSSIKAIHGTLPCRKSRRLSFPSAETARTAKQAVMRNFRSRNRTARRKKGLRMVQLLRPACDMSSQQTLSEAPRMQPTARISSPS